MKAYVTQKLTGNRKLPGPSTWNKQLSAVRPWVVGLSE